MPLDIPMGGSRFTNAHDPTFNGHGEGHKYPSPQNNLPHESPPCDHGFENNLILLLSLNGSVSYRKLRKKIKEI